MNQIDFDGSSALDALGDSAIGDSDGDGQLEIVDAWGEPIRFLFHQENLTRTNPLLVPSDGVWGVSSPNLMTEFESETAAVPAAAKPVRVDQIRPFVTSLRLLEIDQQPEDFDDL